MKPNQFIQGDCLEAMRAMLAESFAAVNGAMERDMEMRDFGDSDTSLHPLRGGAGGGGTRTPDTRIMIKPLKLFLLSFNILRAKK